MVKRIVASTNRNIGKIIKQQRNSVSLTLKQLSEMSGVSMSHLGRIENGQRSPSHHTLQLIFKPLGFDLFELLIIAGYLLPEHSVFSEEQRDKLRAELKILTERVEIDFNRIMDIANRLLMTS
jgi:transcriptional regulator with XRE-family HTH domain